RDQVSARRLASDPARDEGDTGKLGDAELRFRFHALLDLLDIVGRWLAAHAEPAPCARLIGLEACRVDVHANRRRLRRFRIEADEPGESGGWNHVVVAESRRYAVSEELHDQQAPRLIDRERGRQSRMCEDTERDELDEDDPPP